MFCLEKKETHKLQCYNYLAKCWADLSSISRVAAGRCRLCQYVLYVRHHNPLLITSRFLNKGQNFSKNLLENKEMNFKNGVINRVIMARVLYFKIRKGEDHTWVGTQVNSAHRQKAVTLFKTTVFPLNILSWIVSPLIFQTQYVQLYIEWGTWYLRH